MNERVRIIGGGLIAALLAVGVVEVIYSLTEAITAGRLIALVVTIITTGVLYALTYVYSGARQGELKGLPAGIFAGAIGGLLSWAIAEAIFGSFQVTGLLLVALIGGFLFSVQIDPQEA
jgi:hypothetical protein